MNEAQVRDFISRVVPWPGVNAPGYVNLHWKSPSPRDPAKDYWGGRPVKSVNDFIWWLNWALKRPSMKDIYFCTSLQREVGKNKKGNPAVIRSKEFAVSLKAIWLDVDVKEKGYATLEVALEAVMNFVKAAALPPPSALIATGGGLHVYWISNVALTPEDWQPYAEGLKALALKHELQFDASVTADSARILRVPGTFNHKSLPLRPVRVLGMRDATYDYDFSTSLEMLPKIAPPPKNPSFKFIESGPQKQAWAFSNLPKETLSDGLDKREELPPLDWEPIAQGCKFIGDALRTGGADYTQPMWNLTTLAATFMEQGHQLAHAMGRQHRGYSPESTEALWERKNRERKDRGLGWPSCAAIQASGCNSCAACPHFSKGKSPLNLAPIQKAVAPTGALAITTGEEVLELPSGYALNQDGIVCKIALLKKGEKGEPALTELVPLFHTKIYDAWLTEPDTLNMLIGVGVDKQGHVKTETCDIALSKLINGKEMWQGLQKQRFAPIPRRLEDGANFLMAFLTKLRNEKAAREMTPFGWWWDERDEHRQRHGFVYGGKLFKDDGTEDISSTGDNHTRNLYRPRGGIEPWLKAMKAITAQKRPALEIIVASAFAAPLITSTGEKSCFLSVYGDTGKGKSSAVETAQAVWGHAKKAKQVTSTTANSTIGRSGAIKNLPLYWDEVREEESYKSVYTVLFNLIEGVEKGRMWADGTQREQGDWQTMMTVCSNSSFVDYIVKRAKTDEAAIQRCFEIYVENPGDNYPGKMDGMEASRMFQELQQNYGQMGLLYAKLLGSDPEGIDKMVADANTTFLAAIGGERQKERFWRASCVACIVGATLANLLGCNFDVPAMRAFLLESYMKNRERVDNENTAGGSVDNTEELLALFLKWAGGETVWTTSMPTTAGKPLPGSINVLYGPLTTHPKEIAAQFAINNSLLRISRDQFRAFLEERNISPAPVRRGLKQFFGMEERKGQLCGGTQYRCGPESLMHIPVKEGTWLCELMYAHSNRLEPAA